MSSESATKREAGMREAERFVTTVARDLKLEGSVGSLLWWPADASHGGDAILPLRIYKGNRWGAIEFASADIDGCPESPQELEKYHAEIAAILTDL